MKKNLLFFFTGAFMATTLMVTLPAVAEPITKTVEVAINRVGLEVNGQKVNKETLLYNDTLYVPVRAVAEMLDKNVGWDSVNEIAKITDKSQPATSGPTQQSIADYIEISNIMTLTSSTTAKTSFTLKNPAGTEKTAKEFVKGILWYSTVGTVALDLENSTLIVDSTSGSLKAGNTVTLSGVDSTSGRVITKSFTLSN